MLLHHSRYTFGLSTAAGCFLPGETLERLGATVHGVSGHIPTCCSDAAAAAGPTPRHVSGSRRSAPVCGLRGSPRAHSVTPEMLRVFGNSAAKNRPAAAELRRYRRGGCPSRDLARWPRSRSASRLKAWFDTLAHDALLFFFFF